MPGPALISQLVSDVAAASPIPNRLEELDSRSRRHVESAARRLDLTPADALTQLFADEKANAADLAEAHAIAKAVRR
ncbi:hypothetical protein [Leifsonia xyli]|uniref:hypothetical protein n=1 Tax=Leifsonia xyli TaxID=1575 RepID=UPI003D66C00B